VTPGTDYPSLPDYSRAFCNLLAEMVILRRNMPQITLVSHLLVIGDAP
jgi:hypothetical protein